MDSVVELNSIQRKILSEFYDKPAKKVSFRTSERKKIWNQFKKQRNLKDFAYLEDEIPAFFAELNKAINHDKNIQPAVFSECVYAQTLAKIFDLPLFKNHKNEIWDNSGFEGSNIELITNLNVRYSYSGIDTKKSLIQAGGANGVDCALISYEEKIVTMIELKEPYARTSAPDLPKYGEDGMLVSTIDFLREYPQFKSMLEEQIKNGFDIFEHIGNNFSNFSKTSVEKAVTENYSGLKYAHFVCTEDVSGYLVLIPSSHVAMWAKLEGELRPTGRNSYPVWTPIKLRNVIREKGGEIHGEKVEMPLASFKQSKARGGEKISRFKISPLFFIRSDDVEITEREVSFKLENVRQNIPDITAKINFKHLDISKVQEYYTDKI